MKINDLSTNHNAWLNETKLSKDLKEAYYDRNDYYDARQGGEYGKGMTYTRSGNSSGPGYDHDELKGKTKHLPADPFGRTSGQVPKSDKGKVHNIARADEMEEGVEDSPVAGAITRRILMQRHDLLSKYGPVAVTQAIDDVADFVGDVEEIGSSDVSGWIKQVEQSLAGMGEGIEEAGGLDRYRQRVQSQGFTASPDERDTRRQEYDDASHQSQLNRMSASDRRYAAWLQHQTDVDAHRLGRMQKDDDDWEKTFDMMRDRMNRYQWSSQRDVDPEQLAAISNIKYEPRKKNEAVQAKTDDKLLAYYAQRKAEKEKQSQHVEESSNDYRDEYNSFKGQ